MVFSKVEFNGDDFKYTSAYFAGNEYLYGNQEIFNYHSKRAVQIGKTIIENEKDSFTLLIFYFGLERWICECKQKIEEYDFLINSFDPEDFKKIILNENVHEMGIARHYYGIL